jgi:DNA invertase Pin-like site-specific DNA recombinase
VPRNEPHDAIYVRVSSKTRQDTASQLPDLKRWAKAQDTDIEWYTDKVTGKTMNRPDWNELESNMRRGLVSRIVVWRIDRLGRTAAGLTTLFEELVARKVGLICLRDGLDLSTPGGRLVAGVLANVAQFETEIRVERIVAGLEAARERGTRSGKPIGRPVGSGKPYKVTNERREHVLLMLSRWEPVLAIARVVGLSNHTVYRIVREELGRRGIDNAGDDPVYELRRKLRDEAELARLRSG